MDDNKKWFRPKRYGWGVEPISWEGWLATIVFILLMLAGAYFIGFFEEPITKAKVYQFLALVLIFTAGFINWTRDKMEGELRWQWGKKKK